MVWEASIIPWQIRPRLEPVQLISGKRLADLNVPQSGWLLHDKTQTFHDNNPRLWSMPEFPNVPFARASHFTVLDLTAAPGISAGS